MTVPMKQAEGMEQAFEQFSKAAPLPGFVPPQVADSFQEVRRAVFIVAFNAGVKWLRDRVIEDCEGPK